MYSFSSNRSKHDALELLNAHWDRTLIRTAKDWRTEFLANSKKKYDRAPKDHRLFQDKGIVALANGTCTRSASTITNYFCEVAIEWNKRNGSYFILSFGYSEEFKPAIQFGFFNLPEGKHSYVLTVGLCPLSPPNSKYHRRAIVEILESRFSEKLNKHIEKPIPHGKELWLHNQIVVPFTYFGQSDKKAMLKCQILQQGFGLAYFTHIQLVQLR